MGKFSFKRSINSYSKVRIWYGNLIRGNKIQLTNIKYKNYINIGCGNNLSDYMINIDYSWVPGLDLCWDITCGIPLPDNNFQGIFTEHCLEHISFVGVCKLLQEFKRLLKPGGLLRIVVPDAELYLDIYQSLKSGSVRNFPYGMPQHPGSVQGTPMMAINAVFRDHGHLYAYDFETMANMLTYAGYEQITRQDFNYGSDPKLLIDSKYRACESLYIEAQKP